VAVYGGFGGGETSRDQRSPAHHPTILSGDLDGDDGAGWAHMEDNSYHVVTAIDTDSTAVLDGFTIARGRATDSSGSGGHGAGIRIVNASPVVGGCTVKENISGNGSGVAILGGSPRFSRSVFAGNFTSYGRGGAVHSGTGSHPTFADCVFSDNTATTGGSLGYAGAIYADVGSTLRVYRSTFVGNQTTFGCCGGIAAAEGGAIVILGDGSWIEDTVFLDNWAHNAGAVYALGDTTFVNCTFSGNTAMDPELVPGGVGGALAVVFADVTLSGCVFTGNFASSDGGGVFIGQGGHVLVTNSILWGNTSGPDTFPIHAQIHGSSDLRHSCIQALFETIPDEDPPDPENFPGCIDADPQLVDADGPDGVAGTLDDDLRLAADSPCIDAGENLGHPPGTWTDLVGHARRFDDPATTDTGLGAPPVTDMGAHELGSTPDLIRVDKLDAQGSTLELTWSAAACPGAASHHVVYGTRAQLPSAINEPHGLSGAACGVGPTSPRLWEGVPDPTTDPTGLLWFLLVADDGQATEGSWGRNSGGFERYGPAPGGDSGLCGVTSKDPGSVCNP
jgi:hypothetical protein